MELEVVLIFRVEYDIKEDFKDLGNKIPRRNSKEISFNCFWRLFSLKSVERKKYCSIFHGSTELKFDIFLRICHFTSLSLNDPKFSGLGVLRRRKAIKKRQTKERCCPSQTLISIFVLRYFADKRVSDGIQASPQMMNAIAAPGSHTRSTSYSVSYCTRKTNNLPIENKGKKAIENEKYNEFSMNFVVLICF